MPDLGQSPFISFIIPHFISLNRTKRSLLIFKTLICKPPTVFDAQFLFISMGFEFTNTLSSIGNLSPNLWPHFGPIWNLHCLQRDLDWDLYFILLHGSNTLAISHPIPYSSSSSSNQVFKPMVNYLTTTPEPAYHRGFKSFYLCSEYAHSSC